MSPFINLNMTKQNLICQCCDKPIVSGTIVEGFVYDGDKSNVVEVAHYHADCFMQAAITLAEAGEDINITVLDESSEN